MAASHRELVVWQKSMDVAVQVYRLTSRFPKSELYRLTAQLTRAAASVPANTRKATHGRAGGLRALSRHRQRLAERDGDVPVPRPATGYLREHEAAATLFLITEIGKMLTSLRARLA